MAQAETAYTARNAPVPRLRPVPLALAAPHVCALRARAHRLPGARRRCWPSSLPQIPAAMEGNDVGDLRVARRAGGASSGRSRSRCIGAGLFDVFSAWWFLASLWLLVASVTRLHGQPLPLDLAQHPRASAARSGELLRARRQPGRARRQGRRRRCPARSNRRCASAAIRVETFRRRGRDLSLRRPLLVHAARDLHQPSGADHVPRRRAHLEPRGVHEPISSSPRARASPVFAGQRPEPDASRGAGRFGDVR